MSEQSVVLAVATYSSRAAAEHAREKVRGENSGQLAAVVVEKGADGKLGIDRHGINATDLSWGDVLLGSALTVVAAPLGIELLAPIVGNRAEWASIGAVVEHLWHDVPKADLRKMTNLLEDGQAAILVVALGRAPEDIGALFAHAVDLVVSVASRADVEAMLAGAIGEPDAG